MSHDNPSNLSEIMRTVLQLWREERNSRYFVHRGAINWAGFPFEKHLFAVAVLLDESPLLRDSGDMRVSFEIFTRIKPDPTKPGIDDLTLDDLREDCQNVLASLRATKRQGEDEKLILGIFPQPAIEAHDVDNMGVEGIIARIRFSF